MFIVHSRDGIEPYTNRLLIMTVRFSQTCPKIFCPGTDDIQYIKAIVSRDVLGDFDIIYRSREP